MWIGLGKMFMFVSDSSLTLIGNRESLKMTYVMDSVVKIVTFIWAPLPWFITFLGEIMCPVLLPVGNDIP